MITFALLLAGAPLHDAAAALVAGDAEGCTRQVQTALASGALDVPEVARAWSLRGQCFTLAGDADRAERSYAVALRIDASLASAALVDEAFAAAWRALPSPAGLRARAAALDEDTVEIELLADDLLLAKSAVLVRADLPVPEEVARVPLEVGQAHHKVSGAGRAGLIAVLLDQHGNALLRLPVEAGARAFVVPAPAPLAAGKSTPTLLTTLGAAALGVGFAGVVVSGVGLSALGAGALSEGTGWLVGVGAGAGLFVVGAGLIVVDQGL